MPSTSPTKSTRSVARITVRGVQYYLGHWAESDCPVVRDRARLHFGVMPCEAPRRARAIGAASPAALRGLARTAPFRRGRYFGVAQLPSGKFRVGFDRAGVRASVSGYRTATDAAIAADRLSRHLGLPMLNFPRRRLAPASAEELRKELLREKKRDLTSDFLGVVWDATHIARPWCFYILWPGGHTAVGGYGTERDAAIARDRAALHYHDAPRLNFPDEARALGAATLETLRLDVHKERKRKTTSQYRGVCFFKPHGNWAACIRVDHVRHHLGYFDHEHDAALAYDAAVVRYGASMWRLNFPAD